MVERRVARLRAFWEGVSSQAPFIPPSVLDPLRLQHALAPVASLSVREVICGVHINRT